MMTTAGKGNTVQGSVTLYSAASVIQDFRDCKQADFLWFVPKRLEPVVAGYDGFGDDYFQPWVDELFTAAEVEELRRYLREAGDLEIEVHETDYLDPSHSSNMGHVCIPVGGPQGFVELERIAGYNLSVPVWGYYDLRVTDEWRAMDGLRPLGDAPSGRTDKWKTGLPPCVVCGKPMDVVGRVKYCESQGLMPSHAALTCSQNPLAQTKANG